MVLWSLAMRADVALRLFEEGRAAFPDVTLERARFAGHLERHVGDGDDTAKLQVGDLYLACACAAGDARALGHFERLYMSRLGSYVARIDGASEFVDELAQVLRARLLLAGTGKPAPILSYSGRGPLGAWLRVAATRAALDLKAKRGDEAIPVADLGETLGSSADAELKLLRSRYLADFQAVLESALASLRPKERALLRHYVVDGMTVDQIAVIHGVHRATVWRWVTAARNRVLDEARRLLGERLHLPPDALSSLMQAMRSQLRVSIARVLGPG
jgi:RNA polymerase sigma-70 factor (ECF subfamily)